MAADEQGPAPLHGSDGLVTRLRRHAVGIVMLCAGALVAGLLGVFPDAVPWWVPAAALPVASVLIAATYVVAPGTGRRDLHVRAAVHGFALAVVTYATGWGFALPFVHLFGIADNINEGGSRAARAAIGWAVGVTLLAQCLLQLGAVPGADVDDDTTHLIAGLTLVLLVLVSNRLRRAAAEREDAHVALARSEARFRTLVEDAQDIILLLDADLVVTYASPSVGTVLGHAEQEVLGRRYTDGVHPGDRSRAETTLRALADVGSRGRLLRHRVLASDGAWVDVEVSMRNLLDDPTVASVVLSVRDVTERLALQAELEHGRVHDDLTGLPNKQLYEGWLEQGARRAVDPGLAVLVVALEGLDGLADVASHAEVDATIRAVAADLDEWGAGLGRLARTGDTRFALVVDTAGGFARLHTVAEELQRLVRRDVPTTDGAVAVHAAVGIVVREPDAPAAALQRGGDLALRAAQRTPNRIARFDPSMELELTERHTLERELTAAISGGQLVVHYQPLVALDVGDGPPLLAGVEALVRWEHPGRGLLQPGLFIPLAEETGLAVGLGWVVLHEAVGQLATWDAELGHGAVGYVSINVSMHQVATGELPDRVAAVLATHGVGADRIVLELTETSLADEAADVVGQLAALASLGVRLAVDDFGTGYSSLAYLQRFPLDILKIDRAFVSTRSPAHRPALLRQLVELGKALGLRTVAEGIETQDEYAAVRDLGCDIGQGFLFGRPVPPEMITTELLPALTSG